jgi:hypothetical protein
MYVKGDHPERDSAVREASRDIRIFHEMWIRHRPHVAQKVSDGCIATRISTLPQLVQCKRAIDGT